MLSLEMCSWLKRRALAAEVSRIVCIFLFAISLVFDLSAATHTVRPPRGTDATAALKEVFDAVRSGDEVVFQPGVYTVKPAYPAGHATAPLQLHSKTNVSFRAATGDVEIYSDGPGEMLLLSECSSLRFENLTFRSDRTPVQNGNWLYSLIMLYNRNEKLTFENCRFLQFGNHAISQLYGIKQSTDVVIRNCFFADGGDPVAGDGAAVSGIGSRWLLENNLIERCLFGFEIEGPWGTNQNITIRSNTFINPYGCAVVIFATSGDSAHFSDIEISDNVIKDAIRSSAQAAYPSSILVGGGQRVSVLRNVIDGSVGNGIVARAHWADLRDCVIADNIVTNIGFAGIVADEFYVTRHATNSVIRGNIVSDVGLSGITVAGSQILVISNTVENAGRRGDFAGVEVQTLRGTDGVRIEGNTIRNRAADTQEYGIWVRPGVRGVVICPNRFRDNTVRAIFDQGTDTFIEPRLLDATYPSWELGSTVFIFAPPGRRGEIQTTHNFIDWTNVYSFTADSNGEAEVIVTADMIMVSYRYYRAVLVD